MMTSIMLFFPAALILLGVASFVSNRKHLLSMLLSLEFIVLGLFLNLFFFLGTFTFEMSVSVMFLTFSVCEGALGLSILVSMVRTHGNDYFQSFGILEC